MNADDPRHGTYAGRSAGCREECCRRAAADYQRERYFERAVLDSPGRLIDKTGTVRRVQALQRMGWSAEYLSQRLGRSRAYLNVAVNSESRRGVNRRTAQAVAALFEQLCMTPGPSEITRQRAITKGWVSPLAWDDIDDPDERPKADWKPRTDIPDPAVIARFLAGDDLPTTRAEREAIVARWRESGRSLHELEARTGWRTSRYYEVAS